MLIGVHTLDHGFEHTTHGDSAGHNPRYEQRTDLYAADLLIDDQTYRQVDKIYESHLGAIAAEVGITVSLLAIWRDHYERTSA